jgi:hypothetical protein
MEILNASQNSRLFQQLSAIIFQNVNKMANQLLMKKALKNK